jgi:hypothetical protein
VLRHTKVLGGMQAAITQIWMVSTIMAHTSRLLTVLSGTIGKDINIPWKLRQWKSDPVNFDGKYKDHPISY